MWIRSRWNILVSCFLFTALLYACGENLEETSTSSQKLFTKVSAEQSGIHFQNTIEETEESNYYQYMYTYIGGGVATADFNRDGLEDLFFISNSFDNQLYLNRGNFTFEEVSQQAGIVKRPGFDTGVSVADVNQDGWPDIYICRGGWIDRDKRFANMLYIHQGVNDAGEISFVEQAAEYGLADDNRGIQATFFDYDKDGDLDVYIANSPDFEDRASDILPMKSIPTDPKTITQKGSDKLYRNEGSGRFTDVSEAAGILPDIGFGLNPQVGDFNQDGWLDLYVCNDFRIPDFLYINNGDGTFREARDEMLKHMSFNSMGSDVGDINNDGLMDIFTLDMNPEDYVRSKTTMGMTPVHRFEEMVAKGYHYNYMHNMLQLNNGNSTFSEIAQMAGVANTDWSWASLLADFDLDGYNDLFITNGVFRDVIDRDANNKILQILRTNNRKPTKADFLAFTKMLPQQKLNNYFFRNKGDLTFEDVSTQWTDSVPTFSNGAVYADLDNDGDLDVVVNNINSPAEVFQNQASDNHSGNYLQIELLGPPKNIQGIGTVVKLYQHDGSIQIRQMIQSRGFLSAVSGRLHFGLGMAERIDSLETIWPDGKKQILTQVAANQPLKIDYRAASLPPKKAKPESKPLFKKVSIDIVHIDPAYNDYQKQVLLPHKLSQTGPGFAKGDVNGDGKEDIYLGGGHTQAGQLLLANAQGTFSLHTVSAFERDRQKEDVGACFVDIDNDGDLDLYVVSGSYEFDMNSKLLVDRLYLNDGTGHFSKSTGLIPEVPIAGSVAIPADFDQDGDIDLFVGGRVIPGNYPYPPESMLLRNEGGKFSIATPDIAPELTHIGMVTDATWADIDGDQDLDLVLTGEWMGIEVFVNENGQLARHESYAGLAAQVGWWNALTIADVDDDGDQDIVAGNLGLNYKFHASPEKPFHIYTHDFDYNGTTDIILAKYYKNTEVPVRGKTCATQQIPHLAQKITSFHDFASRDLEGILGPAVKSALHYKAVEFRSGIFMHEEGGNFQFRPFDNHIQQSPINSIVYADTDGDGIKDLLMAGNNYMPEIETTRADAGIGAFLKGVGKGHFKAVSHHQSGFFAHDDVRGLLLLKREGDFSIWVINNNGQHALFVPATSPLNIAQR
ncbi:MAG: RNA-binding protein [Bacteroidetes bacterium]|nr:MAG: RNA-binding protein [Bacteroidota bacterium]